MSDNRKILMQYRLDMAKERLESAEILLENNQFKDSIGRSYYAMFSSARALLALEGVDYSKHTGVISHFQKEYIKTGIFDKKYSKYISQAFQIRNNVDYAMEAKRIFGDRLKSVILYGSYARGDFEFDSDIDIMVLLDMPREELTEARKKMRATADALDMEYDCVISSVFQSHDIFEDYKSASPFYQNVERDGVVYG